MTVRTVLIISMGGRAPYVPYAPIERERTYGTETFAVAVRTVFRTLRTVVRCGE